MSAAPRTSGSGSASAIRPDGEQILVPRPLPTCACLCQSPVTPIALVALRSGDRRKLLAAHALLWNQERARPPTMTLYYPRPRDDTPRSLDLSSRASRVSSWAMVSPEKALISDHRHAARFVRPARLTHGPYAEGGRDSLRFVRSESTWLDVPGYDFELLLVDDSPEPYKRRIDEATARFNARFRPRITARRVDGPQKGKGAALRTGVLASSGELVFWMDADMPVPLNNIDRFLRVFEEGKADFIVAERPFERGLSQPVRFVASRVLFALQRALVFQSRAFDDTQCGFKAFRAPLARHIAEQQIIDGGMADIEYLYAALCSGPPGRFAVKPNPEMRASKIDVKRAVREGPIRSGPDQAAWAHRGIPRYVAPRVSVSRHRPLLQPRSAARGASLPAGSGRRRSPHHGVSNVPTKTSLSFTCAAPGSVTRTRSPPRRAIHRPACTSHVRCSSVAGRLIGMEISRSVTSSGASSRGSTEETSV